MKSSARRAAEPLVFLQLNELNFDYLRFYAERGLLPHLRALLERHGVVRTLSESEHHLANPWIQWPSVHTGLTYEEHGIFRLGDSAMARHPQLYGLIEAGGFRVGAVSPFNARNDTKAPCFFVPDPWTPTSFAGARDLARLYRALAAFTDSYATGKASARAYLDLLLGSLPNLEPRLLPPLVASVLAYFVKKERWQRAIICDLLLADCFLHHWRRSRPDFATLFLNGAAHLQHHYLFSSGAYRGERRNPAWHVPPGADPLRDILVSYDAIVGRLLAVSSGSRLLIATGLHQEAHERETFYYRIEDQGAFLDRIGLRYGDTYRLMTEDFVIRFADAAEALRGEELLRAVEASPEGAVFYVETGDSARRTKRTGPAIFHIENRGETLYVQLRPTDRLLPPGLTVTSGNHVIGDFDRLVSLAQYKNTHHVGDGYYLDSALAAGALPETMQLTEIFDVVLDHFGLARPPGHGRGGPPAWLAEARQGSGGTRPQAA